MTTIPSYSRDILQGVPFVTLTGRSMVILGSISCILYVLKILYLIFVFPRFVSPLRDLPGPTDGHWFLGQGKKFIETPWIPHLFQEWSSQAAPGPFLRYLGFANTETLIANSINSYKEILQTKNDFFVKPSLSRKTATVVIGNGLPFAEGHGHRLVRGVMNKLFSPSAIKAAIPMIQRKMQYFGNVLAIQRDERGDIEIESLIWRTVLDVIGEKTIGIDLNHLTSSTSPLYDLFSQTMQQSVLSHIFHYLSSYLPLRHLIPCKSNSNFVRCCDEVREHIMHWVMVRYEAFYRGEPLVGLPDVISVMIEQGGMFSVTNIVEYVLNFLVLGHDTTACSLVWAVHELARNPDFQERLRKEVTALQTIHSEMTHAEIESFHYLENFLREVLRVYCPVAYVPREATRDVEIAGVILPKGTVVQLCPAVINLNPEIWGPDAQVFNPHRWDNLQDQAINAYAFQTFHNGPRVCIGRQFSMIEMKIMLIELVTRFKIESVSDVTEFKFASPSFTLRPMEKLRVRLISL